MILPHPPQPVEQVQSDWNQNDENASDYIKNRICSSVLLSRGFSNEDTDFTEIGSVEDYTLTHYYRIEDVTLDMFNGRMFIQNYEPLTHGYDSSRSGIIDLQEEIPDKLYDVNFGSSAPLYVCLDDNVTFYERTFNKGLYISMFDQDTFEQYYKIEPVENIKKIDEKFLPAPSQLGGVQFKIEDDTLYASLDNGESWGEISVG